MSSETAVAPVITLSLPLPPNIDSVYEFNQERKMYLKCYRARTYSMEVCAAGAHLQPLNGPVAVTVTFYRKDASTDVYKGVNVLIDALQGIAYGNAKQVVELTVKQRVNRDAPRAEVAIAEVAR